MRNEFEVPLEAIRKVNKDWFKGSMRLPSVVFATLLLAGCAGSVNPSPTPTPKELTPAEIAGFCADPKPEMGYLNPTITAKDEHDMQYMIYQLEGPDKLPFIGTALGMTMEGSVGPVLSPDQSQIAYGYIEGKVSLIGRDGEYLRRLTTPPPDAYDVSPKWSADGKRIVFERKFSSEDRAEVHIVDVQTGAELSLGVTPSDTRNERPIFLSNGRVLFTETIRTKHASGELTTTSEVYTINSDGSDKKLVKIDDSPTHSIHYVIPSENRNLIAITSNNQPTIYGRQVPPDPDRVESVSLYNPQTDQVTTIEETNDDALILNIKFRGQERYVRYMTFPRGIKATTYLASIDAQKRYICPPQVNGN